MSFPHIKNAWKKPLTSVTLCNRVLFIRDSSMDELGNPKESQHDRIL